MEALAAKPWVTFRTAKKINRGILTVTHHPTTHYESILTWTHRAPVILQHPNLTIVFNFSIMDAVPCAVLSMRASAIIATIQVKANGIIGTAVPPSPTLIDIFTRFSTWWKHPIVMVAISALTVVPSRQVNAVGTTVTLNKAIRALIYVRFTAGPSEALRAGTHISGNTSSSVPTAVLAKCFARGSIPCIAWFANTVVSSNSIEA